MSSNEKRGLCPVFHLNCNRLFVSGACPILGALFSGKSNMKLGYLFALSCIFHLLAHADIYKSVDEDGHVTYSSTPLKGGKKLNLAPLPTMVPQAVPADFPNVDNATQSARDDTRRKILEDELGSEEKQLATAQQNLKDGEANPEVFKGADGRTYRNVAKYDEKIKQLKDQVDLHQQNVDALKTELSKFKSQQTDSSTRRNTDPSQN
jgi:hypothetical protein